MSEWRVEADDQGGTLAYSGPPRFSARWLTGCDPDELSAIEGPFWSDTHGAGCDDQIHLYAFVWPDGPIARERFEALMQEAARRSDHWISERL